MEKLKRTECVTESRVNRAIAEAMEKAFRRGFQHGYLTGRGAFAQMQRMPTEAEVEHWRFGNAKMATMPPGIRCWKTSAVDRHIVLEAGGIPPRL